MQLLTIKFNKTLLCDYFSAFLPQITRRIRKKFQKKNFLEDEAKISWFMNKSKTERPIHLNNEEAYASRNLCVFSLSNPLSAFLSNCIWEIFDNKNFSLLLHFLNLLKNTTLPPGQSLKDIRWGFLIKRAFSSLSLMKARVSGQYFDFCNWKRKNWRKRLFFRVKLSVKKKLKNSFHVCIKFDFS